MKEYIISIPTHRPGEPDSVVNGEFVGEIIRCKDCKLRGDKSKCIVAFVANKQEFPVFFYDNRGEWFCADGRKKDE